MKNRGKNSSEWNVKCAKENGRRIKLIFNHKKIATLDFKGIRSHHVFLKEYLKAFTVPKIEENLI